MVTNGKPSRACPLPVYQGNSSQDDLNWSQLNMTTWTIYKVPTPTDFTIRNHAIGDGSIELTHPKPAFILAWRRRTGAWRRLAMWVDTSRPAMQIKSEIFRTIRRLAHDIFNEKWTCPETALFVKAPSMHFLGYTFLGLKIWVAQPFIWACLKISKGSKRSLWVGFGHPTVPTLIDSPLCFLETSKPECAI